MPATNPWQEVNQQLGRATLNAAVVVALSCLRQASAAFEAAGVDTPRSAPFDAGSLADVDLRASADELITPILAAKSAVARYAADPETGELILTLAAAPDETTMDRVSHLVETAHGPLLAAVREAIADE